MSESAENPDLEISATLPTDEVVTTSDRTNWASNLPKSIDPRALLRSKTDDGVLPGSEAETSNKAEPPRHLKETWTLVRGIPLFSRTSPGPEGNHRTAIVHLHGFGISGTYMLPTAERLADKYPTYVPDLPGYGRSTKPENTLSIPELADALAAYLDAIEVERAVVLGNSMGSLIALEFADRFPDRAERAVFVSPAGGVNNQPIHRGLSQLTVDATRESPKMAGIAVPDYLKFGPISALKLFHAMTRYPTVERFLEANLPMLIVVGERDPLVNKDRMKQTLREDHDVSLAIHRDAAHAINYSHPEFLSSLVDAFMRDESLGAFAATREDVAIDETDLAKARVAKSNR